MTKVHFNENTGAEKKTKQKKPYNPLPAAVSAMTTHDRFRFGSQHNTVWNNNIFYLDRIRKENARIGIGDRTARIVLPSQTLPEKPSPRTSPAAATARRILAGNGRKPTSRKQEVAPPSLHKESYTSRRIRQTEELLRVEQENRVRMSEKLDELLVLLRPKMSADEMRRQRILAVCLAASTCSLRAHKRGVSKF